ncbi:E3 ubiquitin-protein ligase FANCL [Anopheles darlingi]|uniref:E3 ubiquitin-protein ligase FANCL n=1 Tax=Anopheles darlingi TaxID=43151 RepID=UPI002100327F|nr:E3 ubiquitin-protein ligase FANCL [Anopheles darlingi]
MDDLKKAELQAMQEFLREFPFLVELGHFHFIGLYKRIYKLDMRFPRFPSAEQHYLAIHRGHIRVPVTVERLSFNDAKSFVKSILEALNGQTKDDGTTACLLQGTRDLTAIAFELLSIQQQYRCDVAFNPDITHIEITALRQGKQHMLVLNRTSGQQFKITRHTLPEPAVTESFQRQTTLERHWQIFCDTLDQLEEFYGNLSTIDELCYVVHPTHIDTKTSWRVFKYDRKVFLKVALHPLQPTAVDISFIGPTRMVSGLREQYSEKQDEWDTECNVYTNLLRIFDKMSFPMRPIDPAEAGAEGEDDCGICMGYRDTDNRIPIVSCDNEKCSLIFHVFCLKEWFATQRESKKFFTISIGNCPYCKHKISSSFDDLIAL